MERFTQREIADVAGIGPLEGPDAQDRLPDVIARLMGHARHTVEMSVDNDHPGHGPYGEGPYGEVTAVGCVCGDEEGTFAPSRITFRLRWMSGGPMPDLTHTEVALIRVPMNQIDGHGNPTPIFSFTLQGQVPYKMERFNVAPLGEPALYAVEVKVPSGLAVAFAIDVE